MSYLMIENEGICPLAGFTVLGVSTARGTDRIGQFGTGNKHAVNLLLREQIDPVIFCGKDKITFETKPEKMNDKIYNRVMYRINNKKAQATGFSTEFGELDWNNVDMALREFVSNAIDQNNGEKCTIEVKDTPRAKDGYTRIFIPLDYRVQNYYNNLSESFLQFDTDYDGSTCIPITESRVPRLYRRGVFVCETGGTQAGCFDYNATDLPIDECRNLDMWRARGIIAGVFGQDENAFVTVMNKLIKNDKCWETEKISLYDMPGETHKKWVEWWSKHFGGKIIASNKIVYEHSIKKGNDTVLINNGWFEWMARIGIPTADSKIADVVKKGYEPTKASPQLIKNVDAIWTILVDFQLTQNRELPNLMEFEKIMDGGCELCGQYDKQTKTVYIHKDHVHNPVTILEELAHHITNANDGTRDFQDYALRVATRLMLLDWNER